MSLGRPTCVCDGLRGVISSETTGSTRNILEVLALMDLFVLFILHVCNSQSTQDQTSSFDCTMVLLVVGLPLLKPLAFSSVTGLSAKRFRRGCCQTRTPSPTAWFSCLACLMEPGCRSFEAFLFLVVSNGNQRNPTHYLQHPV